MTMRIFLNKNNFFLILLNFIKFNIKMNTPSRLSNLSMHSVNTTTSHNVERITALAEKLNQIQVKFKKI